MISSTPRPLYLLVPIGPRRQYRLFEEGRKRLQIYYHNFLVVHTVVNSDYDDYDTSRH
jgi:hypothetical protein